MPEKPGTPEAVDWSTSHVELTWKAPAHDGGAPITGYIVEKKDKYRSVSSGLAMALAINSYVCLLHEENIMLWVLVILWCPAVSPSELRDYSSALFFTYLSVSASVIYAVADLVANVPLCINLREYQL